MTAWLFELAVDAAWWLRAHPRAGLSIVAVLTLVKVVLDANLTWVYFITTKDGEAVRVGITRFGRYRRRMREYRTGKDSSTRRGDDWHRRVRWWTPPLPARVARRLGCCGRSPAGVWPGWWRGGRTLELHLTRSRAKAYETSVIQSVEPRFNFAENRRVAERRAARLRRGKVAA